MLVAATSQIRLRSTFFARVLPFSILAGLVGEKKILYSESMSG